MSVALLVRCCIDVFYECSLDFPGRRFRSKEVSKRMISAKTSQKKLFGEELVVPPYRKNTCLVV